MRVTRVIRPHLLISGVKGSLMVAVVEAPSVVVVEVPVLELKPAGLQQHIKA
jgi:hypothetical protein